jgi:hypothetical protein
MTEKLPEVVMFDFKEIVTEMVRKKNLHEGFWALYVEFGLTAATMGFRNADDPNSPKGLDDGQPEIMLPTAIIPIKKIGLVRAPMETTISVDASVVNPKRKQSSMAGGPPKKKK